MIYCVDLVGNILSIDGPWDEFAAENGGVDLKSKNLIGKNLFSFISSSGVSEAFRTMHHHLNDNPTHRLEFSYRCDSPELRRDMKMVMESTGEGIRYTSSVASTSLLDPPIPIDYSTGTNEYLRMCSWCKRFKYPSESEHWNELVRLFDISPSNFTISHGICEDCRNKVSFLKVN
jgi:hypothetical protein